MKTQTTQVDRSEASRRLVGFWLLAVCALIALMVVIGGATRLTNSGLSITEWRPVTGVVPPLNEAAWQKAFEEYQKIPQYAALNLGMSLDGFKAIYWWEWGHRLLARLLGFVFGIPLVWFLLTGRLGRHLIRRLVLIFALGGAQGVLGWYMVESGLANRIEVSQYRLAAHLGLAFVIFALTWWTALSVLRRRPQPSGGAPALRPVAVALSLLVFCQVLLGAFVAGLRAGYRYNTWPLMEGRFVPAGAATLHPFWRNLFENQATAQFDHRIGAYVVLAVIVALWAFARPRAQAPALRRALDILLGLGLVQVALGIFTLLSVVALPLGLLHQSGALALFAAALNLAHVAATGGAAQSAGVTSSPAVPIRS